MMLRCGVLISLIKLGRVDDVNVSDTLAVDPTVGTRLSCARGIPF